MLICACPVKYLERDQRSEFNRGNLRIVYKSATHPCILRCGGVKSITQYSASAYIFFDALYIPKKFINNCNHYLKYFFKKVLKCARFLLISPLIVKMIHEDELEDEIIILEIQLFPELKGCELWYH